MSIKTLFAKILELKVIKDGQNKITVEGWDRLMKIVISVLFVGVHTATYFILGQNPNTWIPTGLSTTAIFIINPIFFLSYLRSKHTNNPRIHKMKKKGIIYDEEKHKDKVEKSFSLF